MVLIAILGTAQGTGPFAVPDFRHSMALTWLFMVVATLSTMILGAVLSERRLAEDALRRNQERLQLLNSIATGMSLGTPVSESIELVVSGVAAYFPEFRVAYSTCDAAGQLDVLVCDGPSNMPDLRGLRADLSLAPQYLAALHGSDPVVSGDTSRDPRFTPLAEAMRAGNTLAVVDVSIQHSDKLVGLLCLDAPQVHEWTQHQHPDTCRCRTAPLAHAAGRGK